MSQLENILKALDATHPELPNCLQVLNKHVQALHDHFADYRSGKAKLSLKTLGTIYKAILDALDDVDRKFKAYKTSSELKELIPVGYAKIATRVRRVVVDLHQVSAGAPKAERVGARELVQMYLDSFPHHDFVEMLIASYERVKAKRQTAKLGSSSVGDREVKKLASSYSKYYSKLPRDLKGFPFKAFRIPITPLYEDVAAQIDPGIIERAGFDVTRVGDGYLVLENQNIIAFDYEAMGWESGFSNTIKGTKVIQLTGPQRVAYGQAKVDSINSVLDTINAKSSVKFVLASTLLIPNPRNPKIWLAWIVSTSQRRHLEQALKTTEVVWGLPFASGDE